MIQQRINTVEGLVKSISIAVNNLVAEDDTMKPVSERTDSLNSIQNMITVARLELLKAKKELEEIYY
ncbi:hypothetical protein [Anaerobutyricum hallii]|jgi:hypothetical protein|uniref:hypothetical protein n=1 Tax=Anaerobutyricum hallii TaxID=39488 RepID=UPI000821378A|nr:hypothetical protein [Anaerobutyricum hallii]SCJ63272.1 Uncharacterised protein [uncultured Eubacterium sp.]